MILEVDWGAQKKNYEVHVRGMKKNASRLTPKVAVLDKIYVK